MSFQGPLMSSPSPVWQGVPDTAVVSAANEVS